MKEDKVITTFTCDGCGKKSEERESKDGFPYSLGWRYLYNLSYKKKNSRQVVLKDKHFCSDKCMQEFVNKELNRESD